MEVILLERVEKLGGLGDVVRVKDGFARNFLLPQGKALRATQANRDRFEREREVLEKVNAERRQAAASEGESLDGQSFVLIRQAGESGQLYGSVSSRDVADAIAATGVSIARSQVRLDHPIKAVGVHDIEVRLHAEVAVTITVNVARTQDEAERQERGEDVIAAQHDEDRAIADAQAAELFEANEEREGAEFAAGEDGEITPMPGEELDAEAAPEGEDETPA